MSNFMKFWNAYPKRWNQTNAKRAWGDLGLEKKPEEVEKILASIIEFKKSPQWKKITPEGVRGQFIPLPANFLRDERWKDDLEIDIEEDKPRW